MLSITEQNFNDYLDRVSRIGEIELQEQKVLDVVCQWYMDCIQTKHMVDVLPVYEAVEMYVKLVKEKYNVC